MSFGLVSAPSTFLRLMDEILSGLHEFAVAYLDDILIHSQTWAQHLQHLECAFGKLRQVGLRVMGRKCTFGSANCVYLGYVMGSGTVRPMEGKVDAIKDFQRPSTKKDVR